jgi:hypothetical protein
MIFLVDNTFLMKLLILVLLIITNWLLLILKHIIIMIIIFLLINYYYLNLNKQKFNDFSSFITKTKYFIDFMKIYKTFLNNNILLIKILTSFWQNNTSL